MLSLLRAQVYWLLYGSELMRLSWTGDKIWSMSQKSHSIISEDSILALGVLSDISLPLIVCYQANAAIE